MNAVQSPVFDLEVSTIQPEPDLELEGQAIAHMLTVMQQLPRRSRDRVLTVIIDLAAPGPMSGGSFIPVAARGVVEEDAPEEEDENP